MPIAIIRGLRRVSSRVRLDSANSFRVRVCQLVTTQYPTSGTTTVELQLEQSSLDKKGL